MGCRNICTYNHDHDLLSDQVATRDRKAGTIERLVRSLETIVLIDGFLNVKLD